MSAKEPGPPVLKIDPKQKQEPVDRMVVQLVVHHQPHMEQAKAMQIASSMTLETREDPYFRRMEAKEEWSLLDLSQVKTPGLIVIENRAISSSGRMTIPTTEEKEQMKLKNLLISAAEDDSSPPFKIPPGYPFATCLTDTTKLYIRSESGTIIYALHIFPR